MASSGIVLFTCLVVSISLCDALRPYPLVTITASPISSLPSAISSSWAQLRHALGCAFPFQELKGKEPTGLAKGHGEEGLVQQLPAAEAAIGVQPNEPMLGIRTDLSTAGAAQPSDASEDDDDRVWTVARPLVEAQQVGDQDLSLALDERSKFSVTDAAVFANTGEDAASFRFSDRDEGDGDREEEVEPVSDDFEAQLGSVLEQPLDAADQSIEEDAVEKDVDQSLEDVAATTSLLSSEMPEDVDVFEETTEELSGHSPQFVDQQRNPARLVSSFILELQEEEAKDNAYGNGELELSSSTLVRRKVITTTTEVQTEGVLLPEELLDSLPELFPLEEDAELESSMVRSNEVDREVKDISAINSSPSGSIIEMLF